MLDALVNEEVVNRVGGRFKLATLIQHRVRELMDGSRPLVERAGRSHLEVVVDEIQQGKIEIAWPEEHEQSKAGEDLSGGES
jgi:DNA-directed RNA polymerase subunit omega